MSIIIYLPAAKADLLVALRHWSGLKWAQDEAGVWVRGFTEESAELPAVKSLPYITRYREESGQLYPLGALLPVRRIPTLLWTPIDRALPVESPDYNHNYFGLAESVVLGLVPLEATQEPMVLRVPRDTLNAYIEHAPAIRLQPLQWVIDAAGEALVVGTPLLPLPGHSYWRQGDHLLPAGYGFEFPELADYLTLTNDSLYLWSLAGNYTQVPKKSLRPLSRSSVRLSRHLTLPNT